jgi:hypothetical protein
MVLFLFGHPLILVSAVADLPAFSADVNCRAGRIVFVQPRTQMVRSIESCVTSGLIAPGVRADAGARSVPTRTQCQDNKGNS